LTLPPSACFLKVFVYFSPLHTYAYQAFERVAITWVVGAMSLCGWFLRFSNNDIAKNWDVLIWLPFPKDGQF